MIGSRFGSLTVLAVSRGAKNVHPTATCRCDCGETRRVRQSPLRRGLIDCCKRCSMKRAWARRPRISPAERELCNKESEYRANAKSRGLEWQLDRETFRALYAGPCTYCAATPAKGIDRAENGEGYTEVNSVSCCSACNYAKRDLSRQEFLKWVGRVFGHSCA